MAALAEILADADQRLLVAETPGGIVGCVQISRRDGETAYLGLLSVAPRMQAGGLGRRLIAAAEEAAAPSADAAKGGAACTPPRLAVLDMLRWLIVVRAELTLNPPPRPSELLAAQASLQV